MTSTPAPAIDHLEFTIPGDWRAPVVWGPLIGAEGEEGVDLTDAAWSVIVEASQHWNFDAIFATWSKANGRIELDVAEVTIDIDNVPTVVETSTIRIKHGATFSLTLFPFIAYFRCYIQRGTGVSLERYPVAGGTMRARTDTRP